MLEFYKCIGDNDHDCLTFAFTKVKFKWAICNLIYSQVSSTFVLQRPSICERKDWLAVSSWKTNNCRAINKNLSTSTYTYEIEKKYIGQIQKFW